MLIHKYALTTVQARVQTSCAPYVRAYARFLSANRLPHAYQRTTGDTRRCT